MVRSMIRVMGYVAAIAVVLGVTPALRAAGLEPEERWFALTIGAERAGWGHYTLNIDEKGRVTSRQEVNFTIKRLGTEMKMEIVSEFTETREKQPLSMRSEQSLGAGKSVTSYEFKPSGVTMTIDAPEGKRTEQLPSLAPGWLTPLGIKDLVEKKIGEGANSFSFTMLDPTLGMKPSAVTQRRLGAAKVMIDGREFPGTEWEIEQSATPGVLTREIDGPDGWPLKTITPMMGFEIVMTATNKADAMAPAGSVELVRPLLLKPDKPMKNARGSHRAVYLLKSAEKPLADIPNAGAQKAQRVDARSIRVTVDAAQNHDTLINEKMRTECLASTALVNWKSECVAAKAKEALAGMPPNAGQLQRAETLRDFVAGYMTNVGMGVGMAGADEVCHTQAGDCTEFAVLLAAVLRAEGIPSRVACGLVYCDTLQEAKNVFGPHMWTQAFVEQGGRKEWVDVDAALGPGKSRFDGGHIAFSVTTLPDDSGASSFMELVGFLGNVKVEILDEK